MFYFNILLKSSQEYVFFGAPNWQDVNLLIDTHEKGYWGIFDAH